MKKFLALALVFIMCLTFVACGSSPDAVNDSNGADVSDKAPYKIAVLEMAITDESVIRAEYYKDYLAPYYNCEFIFSESCDSTEKAVTFIENAKDAGCEAVISFFGMDIEQMTQLCLEKDMLMCVNANRSPYSEAAFTNGYENFMGGFAANQEAIGELYYEYMKGNIDTSEEHGFIITSGGAYGGNLQQYEITEGYLRALQDVYGLTFEKTIDEIITSAAPIEAKNDKNIEVYVYPGSTMQDGWLQGLSSALQTGKYDYCLYSMANYLDTAVTVDEVEKSFNKDIKVISFGAFGDSLTNAFNTMDMFGNATLNMGVVKFTSMASGMAFIEIYNGLTGHADLMKNDKGEPRDFTFGMQTVSSPEQLAVMNTWDKGEKWVVDYSVIDSCLGIHNPDLTSEDIQNNIDAITYENIKERLG